MKDQPPPRVAAVLDRHRQPLHGRGLDPRSDAKLRLKRPHGRQREQDRDHAGGCLHTTLHDSPVLTFQLLPLNDRRSTVSAHVQQHSKSR